MDSIAAKLGMDPAEFRLKNIPKAGDKIVGVPKLRDVSLGETIKIAKEKIGWGNVKLQKIRHRHCHRVMDRERRSRRRRHREGQRRRLRNRAYRQDRHGHHPWFRHSPDCRRGAWRSVSDVTVVNVDTDASPWDAGTVGSRAFSSRALHRGAPRIDARNQIFKMAASKLEASADDLEIVDKQIRVRGTPAKTVASRRHCHRRPQRHRRSHRPRLLR
jgi:CO/xanthine dehydrogenase Mo-binding subunit